MKATIFCRPTSKGVHTFYLAYEDEIYFLFNQNFRRGVHEFYSSGVSLDKAMNFALAHHNTAILHTMEKLPSQIKYVEKQYGIAVLEQTIKKQRARFPYSA